jgi:soluble lytic murein transglycosylase-like protein
MVNAQAAAQYAPIIEPLAAQLGVPVSIANGLFEHESSWNPRAYRPEPGIGDASYGLGQLLLGTARSLGFLGSADQLYDPYLNIPLALKYLAQQYARAGTWPAALSAYNGGWRPAYGYGKELATGGFANQDYVDAVLGKAREFGYADGVSAAGFPLWLGLGLAAAVAVAFLRKLAA